MTEHENTKKKGSTVASYTAAFAGMWSSAARTIGILEQEYRANPSMIAMNLSTSGQAAGFSALGLGAALACFNYYQLSQKKELSDHEALVKKTLLAEIVTQISSSSALLISIVGPTVARTFLASTDTLTGAGANVLGNIFLVSGFISIGLNLARSFSANQELARLKHQRDQDIKMWLPNNNEIKQLSEKEKEVIFKAILTNDMGLIKNAEDLKVTHLLKNAIGQEPSRKEALHGHFNKIREQRFVRNTSIQSFLYSSISVGIVLAMIAFPPSLVIFASVSFLSIVLKFGWDMYRMHQKNIQTHALEEKILSNQDKDFLDSTHSQTVTIKQSITQTSSPLPNDRITVLEDQNVAFMAYKLKFKEVLQEMNRSEAFKPGNNDEMLSERGDLAQETFKRPSNF